MVQTVSEGNKSKKQSQILRSEPLQPERQVKSCYQSRGWHRTEACRFRSEKCRKCGKIGHIAKKCHVTQRSRHTMLPILIVMVIQKTRSQIWRQRNSEMNSIIAMKSAKTGHLVTVTIGGHEITMQLDTGATESIIPKPTYKTYFTEFPLTETKPLKSYLGN